MRTDYEHYILFLYLADIRGCRYINYFLDRVRTLLNHGVIPYVVFDGGPLPMKKGTEDERRKYVNLAGYVLFN